ncbi:MAG: hypothetical protein ACPIOQ_19740 [Promethearchaeia archaeon]
MLAIASDRQRQIPERAVSSAACTVLRVRLDGSAFLTRPAVRIAGALLSWARGA